MGEGLLIRIRVRVFDDFPGGRCCTENLVSQVTHDVYAAEEIRGP